MQIFQQKLNFQCSSLLIKKKFFKSFLFLLQRHYAFVEEVCNKIEYFYDSVKLRVEERKIINLKNFPLNALARFSSFKVDNQQKCNHFFALQVASAEIESSRKKK